MNKQAVIGIRIDQTIKDKLQVEADRQQRTLSNLIQLILRTHLDKK